MDADSLKKEFFPVFHHVDPVFLDLFFSLKPPDDSVSIASVRHALKEVSSRWSSISNPVSYGWTCAKNFERSRSLTKAYSSETPNANPEEKDEFPAVTDFLSRVETPELESRLGKAQVLHITMGVWISPKVALMHLEEAIRLHYDYSNRDKCLVMYQSLCSRDSVPVPHDQEMFAFRRALEKSFNALTMRRKPE